MKVQINPHDDDWPNRIGDATPYTGPGGGWMVYFDNGEAGQYQREKFTIVEPSVGSGEEMGL